MAVRLRYLAHDIDVPPGQFLIGRTNDCRLALEDPLVSRRHALITVQHDGVFLHDLGSRNGVFLNGLRIEKPEPLREGDQIRIGSHDLVIHGVSNVPPKPVGRPHTATLQDVRVADLMRDDYDATTSITSQMPAIERKPSSFTLIGGVADKALAMGRVEDAERMLQRMLTDVMARAKKGEATPALAEEAAVYAARLAGATGRGSWVDYIFELYTAMKALLPARVVDELYAVVRKVKHTDKAMLRSYLDSLRSTAGGFGPAERFVLQRIEGFERWVS
jgi:hypothetical protein